MPSGSDQGQNIFSGKWAMSNFLSIYTQWHTEISATQNFGVCAFWSQILEKFFETSWDHNILTETFTMMCTHHAQNSNPLKFSWQPQNIKNGKI